MNIWKKTGKLLKKIQPCMGLSVCADLYALVYLAGTPDGCTIYHGTLSSGSLYPVC